MSITDNFFRKFNKKPESTSDSDKKDLPESSDSDTGREEKSQKSFLDIIEDLAIRQKSDLPDNYGRPVSDLSSISIKNYQEVETDDQAG